MICMAKLTRCSTYAHGCSERYIRKILPLAYLAPDITEAILHGTQSPTLELKHLVGGKLPLSWNEQRTLLLSFA